MGPYTTKLTKMFAEMASESQDSLDFLLCPRNCDMANFLRPLILNVTIFHGLIGRAVSGGTLIATAGIV